MNILIISTNYPSIYNPSKGTFVYKFVQELCMQGHNVTVISPITYFEKNEKVKKVSYGKELANIYYPMYFSFSNKSILGINTYKLTEFFTVRAIKKVVSKNQLKFDVVYGHFIPGIFTAIKAINKTNIPFIVGVGEYLNIYLFKKRFKEKEYFKIFNKINGFIAVSPLVKERLIETGAASDNIIVEPNGVDLKKFKPYNRLESRKKFNINTNDLILLFVGRFVNDKGPLRIIEAFEKANLNNVKMIFIGHGPQDLNNPNILYKGKLNNEEIPYIMSASDIFILPTLHEGSSNVIVEAMACGLPIISSNIPEIKVQCDDSNSLLVDPNNIDELSNAIKKLVQDNEFREILASNSLKKANDYSITERVKRITSFFEENLNVKVK